MISDLKYSNIQFIPNTLQLMSARYLADIISQTLSNQKIFSTKKIKRILSTDVFALFAFDAMQLNYDFSNTSKMIVPDMYEYYIRFLLSPRGNMFRYYHSLFSTNNKYNELLNTIVENSYNLTKPHFKGYRKVNPNHFITEDEYNNLYSPLYCLDNTFG